MGRKTFLQKNNGRRPSFFDLKKWARTFYRPIFPKTQSRFPVNFDRSLIILKKGVEREMITDFTK